MTHQYCFRGLCALALLNTVGGCQSLRPAGRNADNTTNYCILPEVFVHDTLPTVRTGATPPSVPPDSTGLPLLSARSRQLALTYGLGPDLRQLRQPARTGSGPARADYQAFLRQRGKLVLQVVQASGDASRVTEELECERQRVDQTALGLQALQTKRMNRFTVGSLLMGAASGTISATLQNKATNLLLTVITAGLSAGLGVGTLLVSPQLDYPIQRNLLAPVWYQSPRPALYPPNLWALLNQVRVGRPDSNAPAPLQTIRRRWAQYNQLCDRTAAAHLALYFGAGGPYRLDDLHTRSAMLNQLEIMVRLANQDLQKLLVEVSAIEPQ